MRIFPVLVLVLAATLPLGAAPKPDVREADEVITYRKTEQGALTMEVFRPEGWMATNRRPAIVFFFGGGWKRGSTSQFHPQASHLAKRGMVAICADYRVQSRHQTTPFEAVEDAKAALRWIWRHAKEQGIDPKKIASAGGSAGGHLAACCGVIPGFDERKDGEPEFIPAAMVLFNPVIDTSKKGFGHNVLKERYNEVSPVDHVHDQTPPTLIMVGDADTTTPPQGDRDYAEKMRAHDRTCRLEIYEAQKHGFFNPRGDNEHYWKTLEVTEEFLESQGFIE